jgi:hypothetical protein
LRLGTGAVIKAFLLLDLLGVVRACL